MGGGCNDYGVMVPAPNSDGHLNGNTEVRVESGCTSTLNYAQRRETVCHEMGHSLGLEHRPESVNSCMRVNYPIGKQSPNQHDYDTLHFALYAHND